VHHNPPIAISNPKQEIYSNPTSLQGCIIDLDYAADGNSCFGIIDGGIIKFESVVGGEGNESLVPTGDQYRLVELAIRDENGGEAGGGASGGRLTGDQSWGTEL